MSFNLLEFVKESNRIEGIPEVSEYELQAHVAFLAYPEVTIRALQDLVHTLSGADIREHAGMNVRIGRHYPRPGGPGLVSELDYLLERIAERSIRAYQAHLEYETLHPFMDGNGRSGRALWLHQMGGIAKVPLGFLHTFYYQTLDNLQSRT